MRSEGGSRQAALNSGTGPSRRPSRPGGPAAREAPQTVPAAAGAREGAGYGSERAAPPAGGSSPRARAWCTASSLLRAPSFEKMPRMRERTPS